MPALVSVKRAAELAAVSESTVRRHIAAGDLKAGRVGKSGPVRISTAEIAKWLHPYPKEPR